MTERTSDKSAVATRSWATGLVSAIVCCLTPTSHCKWRTALVSSRNMKDVLGDCISSDQEQC